RGKKNAVELAYKASSTAVKRRQAAIRFPDVIRPILETPDSVNQRLPSGPAVIPAGLLIGVGIANSVAIREQVLGAHHPKTTETRSRFIALLHTMGQHKEAAQLEAAQSEIGLVNASRPGPLVNFPPKCYSGADEYFIEKIPLSASP